MTAFPASIELEVTTAAAATAVVVVISVISGVSKVYTTQLPYDEVISFLGVVVRQLLLLLLLLLW